MDMGLTAKRALITGSSTGLGRAIAEMLATEGSSVIVHGRDRDRTEKVAAGIRDAGGDARAVCGDLATADGARAVAESAGQVDILVNNAGTYDGLGWAILTEPVREMTLRVAAEQCWGTDWSDIERSASAAWFPNDIGRFGRPDEIAAAVTFLCSRHADYISGADLRVDGGVVRTVS